MPQAPGYLLYTVLCKSSVRWSTCLIRATPYKRRVERVRIFASTPRTIALNAVWGDRVSENATQRPREDPANPDGLCMHIRSELEPEVHLDSQKRHAMLETEDWVIGLCMNPWRTEDGGQMMDEGMENGEWRT